MNMKRNKRALSVAAYAGLAAVALTIALPANAVDFKVSGQVDRALTAVDNGAKSDVGFVDNTGSNSRFRFIGSQDMGNGTSVGMTYEIGLTDNSSYSWNVKENKSQAGSDSFVDNRLANVWAKGDWGMVRFGKIWDPGTGSMGMDYSGTAGYGGGTDIEDYAGSLSFVTKNGKVATPITINNSNAVFDEMDGIGRNNGVVYYTPNFSGFSAGVAVFDGHAWEVTPQYETEFGDGGKFGITANYYDTQDLDRQYTPDGRTVVTNGNRHKEYGASTGVLLPSGFNANVGYKKTKYVESKDSAENYYGSVGYRFGNNNLAVNYIQTNNQLAAAGASFDIEDLNGVKTHIDGQDYKSKFRGYGLAYVYNWTDSIDLYASYHLYNLKLKGRNGNADQKFKNINQVYTGVNVRFL